MKYDALVIGAGIGGMESSLKLGDMGYKVLLVEKEASVGGRMILLSKVFPTLDCASCISGPKMSSTINHPNITTVTYGEVKTIRRDGDGRFHATVRQKARYVDPAACTGCQECEQVCTVAVPDEFNSDLVARRAAHIPFPQAVPKKAVITREGTSSCTDTCPAGIKAHGYVSLIRSGKYEEAFQLVLDATPLVGSLGRACYAPCEAECTRGDLEAPLPIRRLKRFIAERHYATHDGPGVQPGEPNGKSVAIVGSGPAGLTAAWQLARKGYRVKILDSAPEPGGFLRQAIPVYRLPQEVVEQDIRNVTALGVEIVTDTRVDDLQALEREGYDAVLLATGTPKATSLGVPGEETTAVVSGLDFLRDVRFAEAPDLEGKRVVIVGGGNVAMDAARSARRLGAVDTLVAYRRGREEMPAHVAEIEDAAKEGVRFEFLVSPVTVVVDASGNVTGLRCTRMKLGEPDASGRRRPEPIPGSEFVIKCDLVIPAIGLVPDTGPFDSHVAVSRNRGIQVDPKTLQSEVPWLFAAGDVVSGASDITHAVGQGRRAAHMIDRWLNGGELDGFEALDDRLAAIDKAKVLSRQKSYTHRDPVKLDVSHVPAPRDFAEIEPVLTEAEAHFAAGGCLDCGVCSECGQCVATCPANAIDLSQHEQTFEVDVGAVVVSTGFKLFAADAKPEYGWGKYPNVITGMQMDRLLAPTRPFNTVLRPSDGKVPDRIAYISCTGSRDKTVGNPLCSKICCMYSVKQNQLIMGALPLADVTMHYIDVRAAGKRYDEFYEESKELGAAYIKGRVAKVTEKPDGNLILHYEDIENGGGLAEAEYDMVVLAVGVQPNREVERLFEGEPLGLDEFAYVAEPNDDLNPGQTSIPGVFVAGTASGAKDIVDSITHAGAAVAQVAAHLEKAAHTLRVLKEVAR
ncbi:MAG: FAD-dependent oxidoreductase [Gemmatimonadetes bacterium]|nr:FAD-dependent oxidoreductase [Gemmatimonadota bacterium]